MELLLLWRKLILTHDAINVTLREFMFKMSDDDGFCDVYHVSQVMIESAF